MAPLDAASITIFMMFLQQKRDAFGGLNCHIYFKYYFVKAHTSKYFASRVWCFDRACYGSVCPCKGYWRVTPLSASVEANP